MISLISSILFPVLFLNFNNVIACRSLITNDPNILNDEPVNTCYDLSPHKVNFVTTEPGVSLEVLDWGGTGEYLILLTGLGDNAHVFDNFAYQLRFSSIVRRGYC